MQVPVKGEKLKKLAMDCVKTTGISAAEIGIAIVLYLNNQPELAAAFAFKGVIDGVAAGVGFSAIPVSTDIALRDAAQVQYLNVYM